MYPIDQYSSNGFASPIRVMTESPSAELADRVQKLRKTDPHLAERALGTNCHLLFPWLHELAQTSEILDEVEQVKVTLSENVKILQEIDENELEVKHESEVEEKHENETQSGQHLEGIPPCFGRRPGHQQKIAADHKKAQPRGTDQICRLFHQREATQGETTEIPVDQTWCIRIHDHKPEDSQRQSPKMIVTDEQQRPSQR